MWKAGAYGNVSLSDGVIEYARTYEEIKGAFLTFQKDADQIYPGWKEQLGYTGESSAQAASFDWKKKAASAAFAGASLAASQKGSAVTRAALDQSSRYAELSLDEDTLIKSDIKGKQKVDTLSGTGGTMPPSWEGEASIAPVPRWLTPRGPEGKEAGGGISCRTPALEHQKGGDGHRPSPRGRADDDFAYVLVGVSVAREGLTPGRVGA